MYRHFLCLLISFLVLIRVEAGTDGVSVSTDALDTDKSAPLEKPELACDSMAEELKNGGFANPQEQKSLDESVRAFVENLKTACPAVSNLEQIQNECGQSATEAFENEDAAMGVLKQQCEALNTSQSGQLSQIMNGRQEDVLLKTLGLNSVIDYFNEKAERCEKTSVGCSDCHPGKNKVCADTISQYAAQIRGQGEHISKIMSFNPDPKDVERLCSGESCFSKSGIKEQDGAVAPETAEAPSEKPDYNNQAGPVPPQQQPPAKSSAGGGLLSGLGGAIGQLLPVAMLAMMMNQSQDDFDKYLKHQEAVGEKVGKDPIAKFCAENPNSQVCVAEVDCDNKEVAALNPQQCLCSDPAVARVTPICNQKPPATDVAGLTSVPSTGGRGLLGASNLTDLLGSQSFNGVPIEGGEVGIDANQRGAGGGGGPTATGGPSAKLGQPGRGGHGRGPYNTDVLKGVGKASGGAAGGAGFAYRAGGGGGDDGSGEGMDLRKFLPKGAVQKRELSGMTLKPADGLTGPMGPSNWHKISRRYKKLQPFLAP